MKLGKASARTRINIRGTYSDKIKEEHKTGPLIEMHVSHLSEIIEEKLNSRSSRRYLSNIGPTGDPALASIILFIIVYFILLLI